ncbi:LuxR family transcriptional regulator [Bradyrhizobium sp. 149]|uniref:LuxR family transcriptional regulator n=1 Tax=Bradyrhizobium sp. 149 TaxID=2782624 RepID=UPI001FF98C2A|nr:LuxR family transcriptional regulator [Bradyrhizobium sp. 149]MCK1651589.1 LuxR family transcriptional regulator [Bradyrhizobium sp. 149]
MDTSERFQTILSAIASASGLQDLSDVIHTVRAPFGVANIVYHAVRIPQAEQPNPLLLLTYDLEWVRRYTERNYFQIDPIVRSGRQGFLPLDWSNVDKETPIARGFFSEADKFGVGRQGVTMPIRGPAGERALFTVTSNASDAEWSKTRLAYMREFLLVGHFFHDRAVELAGFRPPSRKLNLSPREKECLSKIARGDVPKRIASELKLSTNAVQIYLQNARTKLGCSSVAEAAAKALFLELIDV